MTAVPTHSLTDDRPPTTGFAGASPFAPKPVRAAYLTSIRAAEPPFDVHPKLPNGPAALVRRENTPPTPPAAASPTAKSP